MSLTLKLEVKKYEGTGRIMLQPATPFDKQLADKLDNGAIITMCEARGRSRSYHNWFFAIIAAAWEASDLQDIYPSPEHLRKTALVSVGHSLIEDYVFDTVAEANRAAKYFRSYDKLNHGISYAIIQKSGKVVRVSRARSIAEKECDHELFREVVTGVLDWLSKQIGCDASSLVEGVKDVPAWVTERIYE